MTIKAENISKRYFRKTGSANYFYAVSPLNLEIRGGEVTLLMGRSGSGKTTLLNMLAGLLAPTEGRVWIDETDLYSLDDKALSRLRSEKIGVIPQGRSAIDTLTVMENILLPAKLYGKPLPAESARQWMNELGIAHLQDARPRGAKSCWRTSLPATWMMKTQPWFSPRFALPPMRAKSCCW